MSILSTTTLKKYLKYIDKKSDVGYTLQLFIDFEKFSRKKVPKLCADNCSLCCNDYFYISEREFLTICFYIFKNFAAGDINKYINKSQIQLKNLKEKYIREYLKVSLPIKPDKQFEYLYPDTSSILLDCPCPFLNESGKCSIYLVRPFICRIYGSFKNYNNKESFCKYIDSEKLPYLKKFPRYNDIANLSYTNGTISRPFPICDFFGTLLPYYLSNEEKIIKFKSSCHIDIEV